jgi:hypothetical protein
MINEDYCVSIIDKNINNKKGITFEDRFIDIMSDPNNFYIKRCSDAGKIINNVVILHNGIKVYKNCYYGAFSKILTLNKGCHEPAEERIFQIVLDKINNDNSNSLSTNNIMIELGSYWAFYSIWFNKTINNAKNYCIEPDLNNLNIGKKNAVLNNVDIDFTQGFIGKKHINVINFMKEKNIDNIDILHSDIQGYEYEMLIDIEPLLKENKIKYLFISTHSDEIHYKCIDLLKNNNYYIIASADFETETFCFDGIIVASYINIGTYNLGCRKHTKLRNMAY